MVLDSESNDNLFGAGESSNENFEERMIMAKLRAAFDTKVRNFNELCWDLCVDKAGAKLDQKTAMCLSNCVDRFFDASKFIGQRFVQSLQTNGPQM